MLRTVPPIAGSELGRCLRRREVLRLGSATDQTVQASLPAGHRTRNARRRTLTPASRAQSGGAGSDRLAKPGGAAREPAW
jgi:hypothetical protein